MISEHDAAYLEALSFHADRARSAQSSIDAVVAAARDAGLSWEAMGKALGVAPNAVRQRMKQRGLYPPREKRER